MVGPFFAPSQCGVSILQPFRALLASHVEELTAKLASSFGESRIATEAHGDFGVDWSAEGEQLLSLNNGNKSNVQNRQSVYPEKKDGLPKHPRSISSGRSSPIYLLSSSASTVDAESTRYQKDGKKL